MTATKNVASYGVTMETLLTELVSMTCEIERRLAGTHELREMTARWGHPVKPRGRGRRKPGTPNQGEARKVVLIALRWGRRSARRRDDPGECHVRFTSCKVRFTVCWCRPRAPEGSIRVSRRPLSENNTRLGRMVRG